MRIGWSRRSFLKAAGAWGAMTWAGCATTGRPSVRVDGVFPAYVDAKTGAKVYNLTPNDTQAGIVYQTHPMWTPGMKYFVYTSAGLPCALEMATGKSKPLLEKPANWSMQWFSGQIFYQLGSAFYRLDVPSAFQGTGKSVNVAELPENAPQPSGALSVETSSDTVYSTAVLEPDTRWGVIAIDRGGVRTLASVDFKVGHIQANPFEPGVVMFCWETGGDAPQRTWVVDGKGGPPRPVYKEVNEEWVTHEAWWGRDRVIFTIWPYDDAHKKLPHGVAWTDLEGGALHVLAQYPAWHTHGSPDGRWALGDDFDRNLWLIDVATCERRLLTQGHLGKGCKTHPHASFTPDSGAIVLNSSHFGSEQIFFVPLPEWESLPKA